MFDHAAELADAVQAVLEAAAVIALHLALAGELHMERLAEPHLAPARTGSVRDDRPGPVILTRVPLLVPRINAVQAEVAAAGFNKERGDHAATCSRPSSSVLKRIGE
jgi:hypothetical protein